MRAIRFHSALLPALEGKGKCFPTRWHEPAAPQTRVQTVLPVFYLLLFYRRCETSASLWHHKGPWWFSCISVNARNRVFQISWGKSGRSDKASILESSVVVFCAGGTTNALLARNLFRAFSFFFLFCLSIVQGCKTGTRWKIKVS